MVTASAWRLVLRVLLGVVLAIAGPLVAAEMVHAQPIPTGTTSAAATYAPGAHPVTAGLDGSLNPSLVSLAELQAPGSIADDLQAAANRASASVGAGRGPVYGTHVHSSFADELAALGRSDVFSEVSYLNGRLVPYGTRGSVRLDAVVGSPGAPTAIYDLKTGSAALTSSRIAQIRGHLPPGFQDVPILELRPG